MNIMELKKLRTFVGQSSNILKVLSNTGDNTNSTKNVTGFVLHTYVADLTQ